MAPRRTAPDSASGEGVEADGRPWVRIATQSPDPASTQVYRQVAEAIQSGAVPAGARLPSARSLARDLGLHYHTVNKAYQRLRGEGLVVLNHRKELIAQGPRSPGTAFVDDWTDRQRGLLAEAIARGMTPGDLLARLRRLLRPNPETTRRAGGG